MPSYPTAEYSPTFHSDGLTHFRVSAKRGTVTDLVNDLQPFGVRLRKDSGSVSAFRTESGQIRLSIGYLYHWFDSGLTFAWYASDATEAQKKTLLAGAERAALEPSFCKDWDKLRRTKKRGRGAWVRVSLPADIDEFGLAQALEQHDLAFTREREQLQSHAEGAQASTEANELLNF